mgnify:CR=1 FL=1
MSLVAYDALKVAIKPTTIFLQALHTHTKPRRKAGAGESHGTGTALLGSINDCGRPSIGKG